MVTINAVEGPNKIKLASDIPKFTETLPAFGSGAERLSAINTNMPNSTTPKTDTFPYLNSM